MKCRICGKETTNFLGPGVCADCYDRESERERNEREERNKKRKGSARGVTGAVIAGFSFVFAILTLILSIDAVRTAQLPGLEGGLGAAILIIFLVITSIISLVLVVPSIAFGISALCRRAELKNAGEETTPTGLVSGIIAISLDAISILFVIVSYILVFVGIQ